VHFVHNSATGAGREGRTGGGERKRRRRKRRRRRRRSTRAWGDRKIAAARAKFHIFPAE